MWLHINSNKPPNYPHIWQLFLRHYCKIHFSTSQLNNIQSKRNVEIMLTLNKLLNLLLGFDILTYKIEQLWISVKIAFSKLSLKFKNVVLFSALAFGGYSIMTICFRLGYPNVWYPGTQLRHVTMTTISHKHDGLVYVSSKVKNKEANLINLIFEIDRTTYQNSEKRSKIVYRRKIKTNTIFRGKERELWLKLWFTKAS